MVPPVQLTGLKQEMRERAGSFLQLPSPLVQNLAAIPLGGFKIKNDFWAQPQI